MLTLLNLLQTFMIHALVFSFGLLLWAIGEYWVHNILCHHRRMKLASSIHWNHHRIIGGIERVELQAGAYSKATAPMIAAIAMPFLWILFATFLGPAYGFTLTLAFASGYLHYEYIHWRIHCRAPRNQYELKLLQHHFAHHYCDPKRYQSVSLPALDHFFGTLPPLEKQLEHFEKIKTRDPLHSDDNLWSTIHAFTSRHRHFPESFKV